ncbi:MAG TPA: hypothetical protein VIY29_26425 [Ktedonobacteraceae bacterium]
MRTETRILLSYAGAEICGLEYRARERAIDDKIDRAEDSGRVWLHAGCMLAHRGGVAV